MNWIPVSERLPIDDTPVLVFYAWLEGSGKDVGYWDKKDWFLGRKGKVSNSELTGLQVVCWIEIPPDPEYRINVQM